MIEEKKIAKDYSQMFWGAIWVGGRSELVIMDRDLNLGRGRGGGPLSKVSTDL